MFELSLGKILQKDCAGWVLQYEQEFIRGPELEEEPFGQRRWGRRKGRESMKKHDVLEDHLAELSIPSQSVWWCTCRRQGQEVDQTGA